MAGKLPLSSVVVHSVGQAQVAPVAAWTLVGLDGTAATVKFVKVDGGGRSLDSTTITSMVELAVLNQSTGTDDVFFTANDPTAQPTTFGVRVKPGGSISVSFYGSSTPPRCWVYGAAGAPDVQLVATFAELP